MILLESTSLQRFSESAGRRQRDLSHVLTQRAKFLRDRDRLLLDLTLKTQLSRRQIGVAMGVSAGNVSRRLRRLVNRLHDPLVASLCDRGCSLPKEHRELGLEHLLHRRTIAELAREREITKLHARRMIEFIRGWHRGLTTQR